MTKKELNDCIIMSLTLSNPPYPTVKIAKLVGEIWGQPFDGETEKITPQPVSTAPKGTRILLYCKRPIESEGWWQIGMHCPDVCRWIDDDYEPDWMLVQPTYWLPLPQPPQPQ
jgi:hypothetical protein